MDNGACSYRRFLNGDESAFDDIMKEYFNRLVFFINRYVHNVHTAEDIAIMVFSDLVVNKHRYNFKVSFKTYLFMLGKSRALNYLKRQKTLSFVSLNEVENNLGEETDLEKTILKKETELLIANAISSLPEEMQLAVHLIYFENLSYSDAAKVMKKNTKQVDNLLYRAKAKLRDILGKDGKLF